MTIGFLGVLRVVSQNEGKHKTKEPIALLLREVAGDGWVVGFNSRYPHTQ
jgi:hypothetical protein